MGVALLCWGVTAWMGCSQFAAHSLAQDDLDRYVPWHRRYACLAWFTQDWRPTSLLVEMDSPNLGLPCGWAESPLPRWFWT